ncbi:MAG: hypothetical protein IJS03_07095 [Eubacterium sp.]|nr:hypothetical protein [Eubacterium sp.]
MMLFTIINLNDVFYSGDSAVKNNAERSTNPFDFIRMGWFLDNEEMFRGVNNVNLNFDYSSYFTGDFRNTSAK